MSFYPYYIFLWVESLHIECRLSPLRLRTHARKTRTRAQMRVSRVSRVSRIFLPAVFLFRANLRIPK